MHGLIDGFASQGTTVPIVLIAGTNNCLENNSAGNPRAKSAARGEGVAWAGVVNDAYAYLRQTYPANGNISVAAGMDAEPFTLGCGGNYDHNITAAAWLQGYVASTRAGEYDFGSFEDCSIGSGSMACANDANLGGNMRPSQTYTLAESYNPSASSTSQAARVGYLRGVKAYSKGGPQLYVAGGLTQYDACLSRTCRSSTAATPSQGYQLLIDAIVTKYQGGISWHTDIAHERDLQMGRNIMKYPNP